VGARGLFEAFKQDVCLVDAPRTYDDLDLDTPEDYRKALRDIPE
jgi:CTP:molybdopterin cytidylyltransferase MocA